LEEELNQLHHEKAKNEVEVNCVWGREEVC
jgi:hypothetical protein